MKKIVLASLFSLTFLFGTDQTMSIQVKTTTIKDKPSFLGKRVKTLYYGDNVSIQSEKNSWSKVQDLKSKKSGWLHTSALTDKKIILNKTADVKKVASNDEVIMAGKGFSKEVENEYKSKNKELNYNLVDKLETNRVSAKELSYFVKNGKLNLEN